MRLGEESNCLKIAGVAMGLRENAGLPAVLETDFVVSAHSRRVQKKEENESLQRYDKKKRNICGGKAEKEYRVRAWLTLAFQPGSVFTITENASAESVVLGANAPVYVFAV